MSPAIRTIVIFIGLLILVIAASLYFVRTTRTGDAEQAPAMPQEQSSPQPQHPDLQAGLEALSESRPEEARALFESVPESAPAYIAALQNLANMQWQEGDYEGALESFNRLATKLPNDPGAYINMSWALYRLGRPFDSEVTTLRAIEIAPDSVAARYNVAFFRLAQGNIPDAIQAYVRAMRRDGAMEYLAQARAHLLQLQSERPDFPDVHYVLAFFANSIGNRQLEVEELERYLAMNPTGEPVEVARQRLEEAKAALN
jgi:tetratricopeptide (TPR) repeat protein